VARRSALLLVLGVLAGDGVAVAAAPATPAGSPCGPAGGTTLARSRQGRVYRLKHDVYGCVTGDPRPVRLGHAGSCPGSAQLGPVTVAGEVTAYASRTCGVDTSSAQVVVRRLSDGRLLSSNSATDGSPGVESFESVGSIVVRSGGAVGWIGSSSSIATHRSITEVLEQSGGTVRRLDRGSGIRSASLTLRGSTMRWVHGAARRSATLA
jgi:hypothetical protein